MVISEWTCARASIVQRSASSFTFCRQSGRVISFLSFSFHGDKKAQKCKYKWSCLLSKQIHRAKCCCIFAYLSKFSWRHKWWQGYKSKWSSRHSRFVLKANAQSELWHYFSCLHDSQGKSTDSARHVSKRFCNLMETKRANKSKSRWTNCWLNSRNHRAD